MKLTPEAQNDLANLAKQRVAAAMDTVLQLADHPQDRVAIATRVAAFAFGASARFALDVLKADPATSSSDISAADCFDFITKLVAENAKNHPLTDEFRLLQSKASDHQS